MNIDIIELGQRIKQIRKGQKLTQEKLAELIDVSPHYIYEIERGLKTMSLTTLADISTVLNISTDYLLFGYQIQSTIPIPYLTDSLYTLTKDLSLAQRNNLATIVSTIIPYMK